MTKIEAEERSTSIPAFGRRLIASATVESIREVDGAQFIRYGPNSEDVTCLMGTDRIRNLKAGDKGNLYYDWTPSRGRHVFVREVCPFCKGTGERAIFEGDGTPCEENLRLVFCSCVEGQRQAKEQSDTIEDYLG